MADMILEPPEAPSTKRTLLSLSTIIMGDMDDRGLFSGSMKFASDGKKPNAFAKPGEEKSSMTSLYIIPVYLPAYLAPKLNFIKKLFSVLIFFLRNF